MTITTEPWETSRAAVRQHLAQELANWIAQGDWSGPLPGPLPEPLTYAGRIWPGDDKQHGWQYVDDVLAQGLARAIQKAANGATLGDAIRGIGTTGRDPHRVGDGIHRMLWDSGRIDAGSQVAIWQSASGVDAARIIAEAAPAILAGIDR